MPFHDPRSPQATPPWSDDGDAVSLVRPPRRPDVARVAAAPKPVAFDRRRSALVVVDMQNDFCREDGWFGRRGVDLSAVRSVIPAVSEAISGARAQGMTVIRLNWGVRDDCLEMSPGQLAMGRLFNTTEGYGDRPDEGAEGNLVLGTWGAATIDELAPADDEITVHKKRFSGFWYSELDAILRRLDVTTLFFAGINTDRCVLASLQDATFHGYDAVMIDDATATPSPAEVRNAACVLIRQIYGFTMTLGDFTAAAGVAGGNGNQGG